MTAKVAKQEGVEQEGVEQEEEEASLKVSALQIQSKSGWSTRTRGFSRSQHMC